MYIEEINAILDRLQEDENNAVYADDFLEINTIVARAVKELDEREKEVADLSEKIKKLQDANYELLKKAIIVKDEKEEEEKEVEEISLDEIDV